MLRRGITSFRCNGTRSTFGDQRRLIRTALNESSSRSRVRGKFPLDELPANSFGPQQPLVFSRLWKPTGFTVLFSSGVFVAATIWQYENMRYRAKIIAERIKSPKGWLKDKIRQTNGWLRDKLETQEDVFLQKQGSFRQILNVWWQTLPEGLRVFTPIFMVNVAVLLAWRFPQLEAFMTRYFVSNPVSKILCWPMVLSTFSHFSALHFAANMFVLNSFISGIVATMGKEQFVAFYLSAGVVSSLSSYLYKFSIAQSAVSLGASGAIMAILGYVCTKYPETLLSILFLPMFTFKAGVAIKCIMAVDALGMLLKWKLFDHAAHLGGAAFGIAYYHWGSDHIWHKRGPILEWWHKIRSEYGN